MKPRLTAPMRLLTALAVSGLLASCGEREPAQGAAASATPPASGVASAEDAATTKFDHYTDAFNAFIDDVPWNLHRTFDDYQKFDLARADVSEDLSYPETIGLLERGIVQLKAGRAIQAPGAEKADAAADQMIKSGEALLGHWKTLDPYFDSRGYRDDAFAKAKAADPQVRAAFTSTIAGLDALEIALGERQRAVAETRRDQFKKSGNMAGYHAANVMLIADQFSDAALDQNTTAADQLLPQLSTATDALRTAASGLPSTDGNKSELESMASDLSELIGDYRDYKQSLDASDLESLVDNYNDAVESSNDLEWTV